jgi:hypothetical protein
MSHGDQLSKLPTGFGAVAHTSTSPFAAVAHPARHLYGTVPVLVVAGPHTVRMRLIPCAAPQGCSFTRK